MEPNRNMRTHSCLFFLCDFFLKKAWLEEFLLSLSVGVTIIIVNVGKMSRALMFFRG